MQAKLAGVSALLLAAANSADAFKLKKFMKKAEKCRTPLKPIHYTGEDSQAEAMFVEMNSVPGAGADLDKLQESVYKTAFKDGFSYVNCLHEGMRFHADKHEDVNSYAAQNVDVSIVWYKTLVAEEDRKAMTHDVCFSFCRSLENMNFFGLLNSKECYCMPYYKIEVGGEDTLCDSACEGDPSTMCGGLAKTSVFEMHMCADTDGELDDAIMSTALLSGQFEAEVSNLGVCQESMQYIGSSTELYGGQAGDKYMGGMGMSLKKKSGEQYSQMRKGLLAYLDLESQIATLDTMVGADFATSEAVDKAEGMIRDASTMVTKYTPLIKSIGETMKACSGQMGTGHEERLEQYKPITYWVDNKEYKEKGHHTDSVCSAKEKDFLGTFIGDEKDCAYRCDMTVHPKKCVGFQHFSVLGSSTSIPSGVPIKPDDTDGWRQISGFMSMEGSAGKYTMKNSKPSPTDAGKHSRSDNYLNARVKAGFQMKIVFPPNSCHKFSLRMYDSRWKGYELYTQKAWSSTTMPCGKVMWKDGATGKTVELTHDEANKMDFTVSSDSDEVYSSMYFNLYGDHTDGGVKIDFEQIGAQESLAGTCRMFAEPDQLTYYTCEGESKEHAHPKSGDFAQCYLKFSENKGFQLRDDKVNRNDRCLLDEKLEVPELKEFKFHDALDAVKVDKKRTL